MLPDTRGGSPASRHDHSAIGARDISKTIGRNTLASAIFPRKRTPVSVELSHVPLEVARGLKSTVRTSTKSSLYRSRQTDLKASLGVSSSSENAAN